MPKFDKLQTMTDFLSRYGYDTNYIYSSMPGVDPPSDWAVFTMRDRIVSWKLMKLIREQSGFIRSCLRWNDDGEVQVPLSDAEVSLTSAALRKFSAAVSAMSSRYALDGGKGDHETLLFRAVWDKTVLDFMLLWEESGYRYTATGHNLESLHRVPFEERAALLEQVVPDEGSEYNQSDWPAQWTVEFGLAVQEFLATLEGTCEMLAAVCGTSVVSVRTNGELAEMELSRLMGRYRLSAKAIDATHPTKVLLLPEDVYCAAYLAAAFDNLKITLEDEDPYSQQDLMMRRYFAVGELLYLSLDVMTSVNYGLSRLANIINAFIGGEYLPTLNHKPTGAYVHVRAFSPEVWPKVNRLHDLVRDLAGELRIELPREAGGPGTDGLALMQRKLRDLADGNSDSWGKTVDSSTEVPCAQCGRPLPDPKGLSEVWHRLRCPGQQTCLALAIGANRTMECAVCGKAINPQTDSYRVVNQLVRCDDDACE